MNSKVLVHIFSFNCAKILMHAGLQDTIAQSLPTNTQPTFIVCGFQELADIQSSSRGHATNSLVDKQLALHSAIRTKYGADNNYKLIDTHVHGSIGIVAYLLDTRGQGLRKCSKASVGCGLLRSSLKGSVALRVSLWNANEEYTFAVAHLAAKDGMVAKRNRDFQTIARGLDFGDKYGLYKPNSRVFFFGDLNYRVRTKSDAFVNSNDELSHEMAHGQVCQGFREADIGFPPTYKFRVGTANYDSRRVSSWCDRILYREIPGATARDPHVLVYQSHPSQTTSDHVPVSLTIEMDHCSSTDSDVSLQFPPLDRFRTVYSVQGKLADLLLGWTLYLTTTRQGLTVLTVFIVTVYFYSIGKSSPKTVKNVPG